MLIHIRISTLNDVNTILKLYDFAVAKQHEMGATPWPQFEASFIRKEIQEQRQYKLLIGEEVACVWVVDFTDPLIWEEKNNDPSIYIHRIAINPHFKGKHLVKHIVSWAKDFANTHAKQFIRMDTVGNNARLIKHYENCGFDFLGLLRLKNTEKLPSHYDNADVSLFQIALD